MIILFAFIFSYLSVSNPGIAAPVLSSGRSDDAYLFFTRGTTDLPDLCPRKRLEIIWSCVATILAASWVSVHPNLPHPKDSKLKKTLRRLELMFWAILTPELIIFWAMRQWYGARRMEREFSAYQMEEQEKKQNIKPNPVELHIQNEGTSKEATASTELPPEKTHEVVPNNNNHHHTQGGVNLDNFKWTQTHGFFLQMGGFVLQENNKKKSILGWGTLIQHYKDGKIDLSDITEARINDHSKADGFAKGLALLQTCWFIIQSIARFSDRRLVLTELELVTAALAVLSLVMYFLWWNKPFNAEIPIIITLSDVKIASSDQAVEQEAYEGIEERPKSTKFDKFMWIIGCMWGRIKAIVSTFGVADLIERDPLDTQNPDIMKAPTFYSIDTGSYTGAYQMVWASFSVAALFGAIHCAGWSSKIVFSSYATSILWRISSAIITGCPLVWSLYFCSDYIFLESEHGSILDAVFDVLRMVFGCLSVPSVPLYFISRIILLVLAFLELRDVPPAAFGTIRWANFVPFIH